jgi:hypothetical protein
MFQRDYVLRQIQQLIQVLELVIFKRKADQFEEASDVLNGALKDLFGLDVDEIAGLSDSDVVALCTSGGQLVSDKALVLAEILEEEGQARELRGTSLMAPLYFAKALALYEAGLGASGAALPLDIYDRIRTLKSLVSDNQDGDILAN